jgi:hypothetical protein
MRKGQALGVQLPVVVFGIGRVKLFRPWKSCHANDAIVPPHRLTVVLRMLAENGLLREKRDADERDAGNVYMLVGLSQSFSPSPSSSTVASPSSVKAARDRRRQRALEVINTTQGFRRILKMAVREREREEAKREGGEGGAEARGAVVYEATSPTGWLWTSAAQPGEGHANPSGAVRFLRWLVDTVEEGLNVDAFRRLDKEEARLRLAVCGNLPGDVLDLIRDFV